MKLNKENEMGEIRNICKNNSKTTKRKGHEDVVGALQPSAGGRGTERCCDYVITKAAFVRKMNKETKKKR